MQCSTQSEVLKGYWPKLPTRERGGTRTTTACFAYSGENSTQATDNSLPESTHPSIALPSSPLLPIDTPLPHLHHARVFKNRAASCREAAAVPQGQRSSCLRLVAGRHGPSREYPQLRAHQLTSHSTDKLLGCKCSVPSTPRVTVTHRHPTQAILGITEAFKADTNPKKINLGPSIPTLCQEATADQRRCRCIPR